MTKIITDISKNIQWVIRKGVFNSFTITFTQSAVAFDISAYNFSIHFQKFESDSNIVSLTQSAGITNGGASGILTIVLDETNSDLLNDDIYYWELKYVFSTKNYTLLQGSAIVNKQISTEDTETSLSIAVNLTGSNLQAEVNIVASSGGGGSGTVESVSSGNGITVDNTDTVNPIVNLNTTYTDARYGQLSTTNAWTGINTFENNELRLFNPAGTFTYSFVGGAIVANRSVLMPLLTGTDTFVMQAFTQALTNKTIVTNSNTITATSAALGDLLKHNGTSYQRFAKGSADQILKVNTAGTDLEFADGGNIFWKASGTTNLSGAPTAVVINGGGGVSDLVLGGSGTELLSLTSYQTVDFHLQTGSSSDFLGQYSIVAGVTKEMETTVSLSGVYDIGIRMGGDAGNGGHLNITSGAGSSTTTTFTISGWDAFRINLGSDAVGDLHYTGTSLNQTRLASVAAGSYLRSGGVATAPVWSTTILPNSATTGDIIFATSSNTYTNLADIATGNVLLSGGIGVIPSYGKVTSSHIDATVQTAGLSYLLASGGTATGTNTFAMGANPFIMTSTNATGTGATAAHQLVVNSLTTGNGLDISSSSITTGYAEKITSTSTVVNHTLGTHAHFGVVSTGANGTASKTVVGGNFIVQNTGTTNTNIGAYFEATGATTNNIAVQAVGDIQTKGSTTTATYNLKLSKYNENTQQSIGLLGQNLFINSAASIAREDTSVSRGQAWVMYTGYSGVPNNNIGWSVFNSGSSTLTHPFFMNQLAVMQLIAGGQFGWVTSTTDSRGTIASLIGHSAGTIQIVPTVGIFVGSASTATAILHVKAGTASANTGPIKIDSSGTGVTGLLTTAEKGSIEFTDRGLWFSPAASTRHKVLHGLVGAAAPATNAIGVIVDYFGTSATRTLNTPNTWISAVGDDGNTYKIPGYS